MLHMTHTVCPFIWNWIRIYLSPHLLFSQRQVTEAFAIGLSLTISINNICLFVCGEASLTKRIDIDWAMCLPRNKFHDLCTSLMKWGPFLTGVPEYLYHRLRIRMPQSLYSFSDKYFAQNQTPSKKIRTLLHLDPSKPHLLQHPTWKARAFARQDGPTVLTHAPTSFTYSFCS